MDLQDSKLDEKVKIKKLSRKERILSMSPEEKSKRKKKRSTIILLFISALILIGLGFLFYKGYIFSKDLGFRLDPNSFISIQKKELKKDSSGKYTNVLIVGLDTRESGNLLNTDTIILMSYNYETNDVTMLSIPRDFHVEIAKDVNWYERINSIYSRAERKESGSGMDALIGSVQRLTGQEIQYYGMVDLKAFVEIIDSVGGIDVNVENSFTDFCYPAKKGESNSIPTCCSGDCGWWKKVSFNAGPQTMDGETALIYARSRHSQQNGEGTDFARAKRQQKVIIALQEKILSDESLSNPKTLIGLVSSIAGNVKLSEFTIKDIEAAFELANTFEENNGKTFSFVLDPSIANAQLVETKNMASGAYAIGPVLGFGKYKDINEYVKLLFDNPLLYFENARVLVYDTGLGSKESREKTEELKKQFPYLNITFSGTLFKDKEGIVVYSQGDEKEFTVKKVSLFLNTKINEKPEYITSNLNREDVTILLGKSIQLKEN